MSAPSTEARARDRAGKNVVRHWARANPLLWLKLRDRYEAENNHLISQTSPASIRQGYAIAYMKATNTVVEATERDIKFVLQGSRNRATYDLSIAMFKLGTEPEPKQAELPLPPNGNRLTKTVGYQMSEAHAFGEFQAVLIQNGYTTQVFSESGGLVVRFWKA